MHNRSLDHILQFLRSQIVAHGGVPFLPPGLYRETQEGNFAESELWPHGRGMGELLEIVFPLFYIFAGNPMLSAKFLDR
jgi:hypothetical protein